MEGQDHAGGSNPTPILPGPPAEQITTGGESFASGCVNASKLRDLYTNGEPFSRHFIERITVLSWLENCRVKAAIDLCENQSCVATKEHMNKVAPRCKASVHWYRDWAIAIMSCLVSIYTELDDPELDDPVIVDSSSLMAHNFFPNALRGFLKAVTFEFRPADIPFSFPELSEMSELTMWMLNICARFDPGRNNLLPDLFLEVSMPPPKYMETSKYTPRIFEALARANELKICPNRLWNLAITSRYGAFDLSSLVFTAYDSIHRGRFGQVGHEDCTSEACQSTDNNSTLVEQLHVCDNKSTCGTLEFPSPMLEASLQDHPPLSAWRIDDGARFSPGIHKGNDYAAISHVWSDGTGMGIGRPSEVNTCLVNFFSSVSRRLSCNGFWWDIISIPTERRARTIALNEMHNNFANAKCTIVHDRSLVQFPWADDGSPCIALLLSPWFTRAWTALELMMSGSVKVLYKGANKHAPLIKDLDTEILAQERSITSRGHYVASSILKRLRETKVDSLSDLQYVLRTRATTYARDRMIIAKLLAGLQMSGQSTSQAQITRDILSSFRYIDFTFLMHGHATQQESGPWSWCPSTIFYSQTAEQQQQSRRSLALWNVSPDGSVYSDRLLRILREEEAKNIQPYAFHPSVTWEVNAALEKWETCLLMHEEGERLALLIQPFAITSIGARSFLDCTYIGPVYHSGPTDESELCSGSIRLGREPQQSFETAERLLEEWQTMEQFESEKRRRELKIMQQQPVGGKYSIL